jgi:hypothetical protein
VADGAQLDVVRRRGGESRTVLGAATTLALAPNGTEAPPHAVLRCSAAELLPCWDPASVLPRWCGAAVLALLPCSRCVPCLPAALQRRCTSEPTRPWPAVVVTRRHDGSPHRRAAQHNWLSRSAPAAELRYFASWQCAHAKRLLTPSLAAGRRPFIKRDPHIRWALTLGHACVADR